MPCTFLYLTYISLFLVHFSTVYDVHFSILIHYFFPCIIQKTNGKLYFTPLPWFFLVVPRLHAASCIVYLGCFRTHHVHQYRAVGNCLSHEVISICSLNNVPRAFWQVYLEKENLFKKKRRKKRKQYLVMLPRVSNIVMYIYLKNRTAKMFWGHVSFGRVNSQAELAWFYDDDA